MRSIGVDVVVGTESRSEVDFGARAINLQLRALFAGYFADVQTRIKKLVESGQLGIFANAYWGNPGYKLPPEANLMAVAHYLDALTGQRQIIQLQTIFGGKNPHPNVLVGGVPSAISVHAGPGNRLNGGE